MITKLSRFSILIVLSLCFIAVTVGIAELNSWLEPQSAAAIVGPQLSISSNIPASPNSTVVVPVIFTSNGSNIASTVFSIDYDETWLSFDETLPNAIEFTLPVDFAGQCAPDQADPDGEIDCFILDPLVPLASLPDGVVLNITLRTKNPLSPVAAKAGFSTSISHHPLQKEENMKEFWKNYNSLDSQLFKNLVRLSFDIIHLLPNICPLIFPRLM